MTRRGFREAAPLALTPRLASLLGAELARVDLATLPEAEATDRLLATARAFLLAGDHAAIPGLGRIVPAGVAPADPDEPAYRPRRWARIAPDPQLDGGWPHAHLTPVDPFAGRFMTFVLPVDLDRDEPVLPPHVPVRRLAEVPGLDQHLREQLPAHVLLAVPEDPTDAFSLPWLNDVAARLSASAGSLTVAGVQGASRALYLGSFEHGRHVSLYREEVAALFGELLPPEPHLPAAPRTLWPLLSIAAAELAAPAHLARRLAHAESGGRVDLDAVSAVAALLAGPAREPPSDPDEPAPEGSDRPVRGPAGPSELLNSVQVVWGSSVPAGTLRTAVERAFGRLSRELAGIVSQEATADLSPLGVLLRIDEPELRTRVPGGPGRVSLAARGNWVLVF